MTLILTVANSQSVHQSSDYRLTASDGDFIPDRAGSKQLECLFDTMQLQLAFTGIAGTPNHRTIDWLSAALRAVPTNSKLQAICNSLSRRCAQEVRRYGRHGLLTLVLCAAMPAQPFQVAVISNVNWSESPPKAKGHFEISIQKITRPFVLISGWRTCVQEAERYRLDALSRATDRPAGEIRDELASINAIAAKSSEGRVSEECWITSQVAAGRVRHVQYKTDSTAVGSVKSIIGGIEMRDWLKANLRAEPGQEIQIRPLAASMFGPGDGRKVPPPEGDAKQFTIAGTSATYELHSPAGAHCATLEMEVLDCPIETRRNARIILPFARVRLVHRAGSADFPRPSLPWPQAPCPITLDGHPILNWWSPSIVYWFEAGSHHLVIPKKSGSTRKIAFLDDEDELVLAIPTPQEIELTLEGSNGVAEVTLDAMVWWRVRMDGTRG